MVPQFLTERLLRERLLELGEQVEFGCELVGMDQDEEGVTTRLRGTAGEEVVRVRYLVGSDGGHSFVRQALGIGFPGKTLGVRAVVADLLLTGLGRDAWHRFGEGAMDRQLALCPLAGTELFQLQAPLPLEGAVDLSTEGLAAMVAERSGRDDIRVQSGSWASAYNMSARLADRYNVGRVFLLGDAAHVHPPTGGQGFNTSVRTLTISGGSSRLSLPARPLHCSIATKRSAGRLRPACSVGLSTQLLDAHKRGDLRRGREVRQLDLAYPESSLAFEKQTRVGGLLPGDRAPDAPVHGCAGQATRLFELFKGPHWTLIGYEAERDAVHPRAGLHVHTFGRRGDIVDDSQYFRDAYGLAAGEWVLVRPDGYVGAIVAAEETGALEDYFHRIGLGAGKRAVV